MTRFHQQPGFQAPCRKPHLSLLYGEFSDQIKEEARDIVKQEYKNIFEEVYEMHTLELVNKETKSICMFWICYISTQHFYSFDSLTTFK